MLKRRKTSFWLCVLLLLAAGARLIGIDAQSIWFDEGWSAYAAGQPTLWAAANADATNPPLYYMLIHLQVLATGESALALRWLSYALGMLATVLVVPLARRVTGSRAAAVLALAVAALSAPLWWASQEMRMYTLLAVLVGVMALAWERLRTRPTAGAWAALLLAELAALYAHNTGPVIVLWLNVATLLAWLVNRRPRLARWVAGQVLVGALWLPYFEARFLSVADANQALVRRTLPGIDVWAAFWLAPWEAITRNPQTALWVGVGVLLVLPLVAWRRSGVRWLALHVLLLTAGLLAALAVLGNEFHGRYLVMAVPLVCVLAGSAAASERWLAGRYRAALVVLLIAVPLGVSLNWRTTPAHQHDDARGMVQHYADTLTAADTVLAWSYADRYELAYYWERLNVAAARVTLPEGATLDQIAGQLPESGDVSLNVWYTQRADYRGMLSCVLGHGTTSEPERFEVNGMSTLTYREPSLDLPATRTMTGDFGVATVDAVGVPPEGFTARQAVCLPVTVTLDRETDAELKAAVTVVNALGQDVARADAVFATANQRTSTDNTAGETLTAYPLLRLPEGAPPTEYEIVLRVYDENALTGYDRLVNGTAAGKTLTVGRWSPQAGAVWDVDEVPADGLRWLGDVPEASLVRNGDTVTETLRWAGDAEAALPTLTLAAVDGAWSADVPPMVDAHDNLTLDWRQFQIPTDAGDGDAQLMLPDGTVVRRYTVREIPMVTTPPETDYPADVTLPGIGTVIGYDLAWDTDALTVTLVWRVADDPVIDRDYTVFVQLLNADNAVAAQSDSPPAGGARPTAGWRGGEFIVDEHRLPLKPGVPFEQGRLIVGMYGADGVRVTLADGADFGILASTIRRLTNINP